MKKTFIRKYLIYILLLAALTVTFFYWASKKEVWFCDEIYTYETANGFESSWPNEAPDTWMSGKDVERFFAADSGDLGFGAITVTLYGDHVPLYFWIFRTLSVLFFRGSASLWIGMTINLVFLLITVSAVYFLLGSKIGDVPAAVITYLVFGMNRLGADHYTFLRMYMMVLCLEILLLMLAFRILRQAEADRFSVADMVLLYGLSTVGLLTHYDFWIFYGVTAGLTCLILLGRALSQLKKNGRTAFRGRSALALYGWILSFALSIFTMDRLFPYWKWNLHKGKGEMALSALFGFSAEKLENIRWGYERLVATVFGEQGAALPVYVLLLTAFGAALIILFRSGRKEDGRDLILTLLISTFYQWIVCFTLPDAREERYLWGCFLIYSLCLGYSLVIIGKHCIGSPRIQMITGALAAVLILILNIQNMDGGRNIAYLFDEEKDVSLLKEYGDIPWVVYGPTCGVYSFCDLMIPDEICFVSEEKTPEDAEALRHLADAEEGYILYVYETLADEAVEYINELNEVNLQARYLTRSTNLQVYLVK